MSDLFSRLVANSVRTATPSAISDPFAEAPSATRTEPLEGPASPVEKSEVPTLSKEVTKAGPDLVRVRQGSPDKPIPREERPDPIHVDVVLDRLVEDRNLTTTHELTVAQANELVPQEGAAHPAPFTPNADAPSEAEAPARSSEDVEPPRLVVDAHVRTPPPNWTHTVSDVAPAASIESQPTVQIHIGRLDVRTNVDQPSSTQRANKDERTATGAKPTLSLDDYLSGRKASR